jgi:hypothetical protein
MYLVCSNSLTPESLLVLLATLLPLPCFLNGVRALWFTCSHRRVPW